MFKGNSLFGKKKQEAEPVINISDQMKLEELDPVTSNKFVDIFNFANQNSMFQFPESSTEVESRMQLIKDTTIKELFGPLTSLAHQIDMGKKTIFDFTEELHKSQEDLNGSSHNKRTPTPFITRFVDGLKTQFYEVDDSIKIVGSTLTSEDTDEQVGQFISTEHYLSESLKCEQQGILRLSSKVSALKTQFDDLRTEIEDKSHFSDLYNKQQKKAKSPNEQRYDTAEGIENRYKTFLSDKKNRMQKKIDNEDLFGADPKNVVVPKKTGFGAVSKPATNSMTNNKIKSAAPPPSGAK